MDNLDQRWNDRAQLLPFRLYWSSRSPFVRKALIAAHEVGVGDRIELIETYVTGKLAVPEIEAVNPLGQLPTLVTATGEIVFGSDTIIDFLDSVYGGHRLIPTDYPRRLDVLRRTAIAQGMKEKLLRWLLMRASPPALKDEDQIAAYSRSLDISLAALEASVAEWGDQPVDAGHVGLAAALGYMDFRFAAHGWRENRPGLSAWHATFAARPSYILTEFVDPKAQAKSA